MMLNSAEIVDDTMVVEGYEEIAVDDDMHDMSVMEGQEDSMTIQYEEVHEEHGYGGMAIELYNEIVNYKRTNEQPASIATRTGDRSAPSHFRARCKVFSMADDNETLLYYNPDTALNSVPRVVVKKGEVRRVLERIHELIGHLGQKRTQMVVLRKLYWRSVRQDVKNFIASCEFCNEKKAQGRKIIKAPVDITSDNFDIAVLVRDTSNGGPGDRLEFNLIGYNEAEVREASMTRMTSYTFKETALQYRSRYSNPNNGPPAFRRQPYIKKHNNQSVGYLLPFQQRSSTMEPEFIQVMPGDVYSHPDMMYESMVPEMEDQMMRDRGDGGEREKRKNSETTDAHPVSFLGNVLNAKNFKQEEEVKFRLEVSNQSPPPSSSRPSTSTTSPQKAPHLEYRTQHHHQAPPTQPPPPANPPTNPHRYAPPRYPLPSKRQMMEMDQEREREQREYRRAPTSPQPTTTAGLVKKRRRGEMPSIRGMANRFSMAIGESDRIDNTEVNRSNPHLIEYPDTSTILRGDNSGLPPVIMAPSTNDEVCKLQIEALHRHIHLQKMQEKMLQEQYEASLRIPITRYIQQEEEAQEEQLDVEHEHDELNVIDEHHEVYEEVVEEDVPQNQRRHIHHQ